MSSRFVLTLPLVAALALPAAALAAGQDAATRAPVAADDARLAQGKSDDAKKAKGKAKDAAKDAAKDKAKKGAKDKAKKSAAKGSEKAAEKRAEKDAKKAEKDADKAAKKEEHDAKKDEKRAAADMGDKDEARRREMEKHERRMAQIARLDSLANSGKKDKLKDKATHLRALEDKRHTRALARIDSMETKTAGGDEPAGDDAKADAPEEKKAAVDVEKKKVVESGDDEAKKRGKRAPARAGKEGDQ